MNTAEGKPVPPKTQIFNNDGSPKLTEEGKEIYKDYTADFGFSQEGAKVVTFKSKGGMRDSTGMMAKPFEPRAEVIQRAKEAGYGTTLYYHGSDKTFTEFKLDQELANSGGRAGEKSAMIYLTENPNEGRAYAYGKVWNKEKSVHEDPKNPNVITAFVKMDNPFEVNSKGEFSQEQLSIIKKYFKPYFGSESSLDYKMLQIENKFKRGDNIYSDFQNLNKADRVKMLKELGYDGVKDGGHIMVFDPEQVKSAKDFTYDDAGNEIPLSERFDKTKKDIRFKPVEDIYEGGRVYDENSKQFKSGFLGLYSELNPERIKGLSLQFMKRADGSHRIRLTDNSKKGESADIGHITANISGDTATLSSHINKDYRGRKLAFVVYSEMAERLRSMGVKSVDGQIVNPDGVPVHVREQIIGDTRDYNTGKPISQSEAATRIRARQKDVGSMGGIDVYNKLHKNARYKPAEGWRDWNSERTAIGSVIKNTIGYAIIMSGNKFRVYNPQKALIGVYTKEEEAKRRVQRDEPKR
jgi:hypothetical protein